MNRLNDRKEMIAQLRRNFKGYGARITLRILAITVVLLLNIALFSGVAWSIRDSLDDKNKVNCQSLCEMYYYDGNYMELLDVLRLYDAHEERFVKYWEIADAYENLTLYKLWNSAFTEVDARPEYEEKAKYHAEQVRASYNACKDEENRLVMKGFLNVIAD